MLINKRPVFRISLKCKTISLDKCSRGLNEIFSFNGLKFHKTLTCRFPPLNNEVINLAWNREDFDLDTLKFQGASEVSICNRNVISIYVAVWNDCDPRDISLSQQAPYPGMDSSRSIGMPPKETASNPKGGEIKILENGYRLFLSFGTNHLLTVE